MCDRVDAYGVDVGSVGVMASVNLDNRTHGSIGTYSVGCRCGVCREAKRLYSKTNPRQAAWTLAHNRASAWMRANAPEAYQQLFDDALAELRGE